MAQFKHGKAVFYTWNLGGIGEPDDLEDLSIDATVRLSTAVDRNQDVDYAIHQLEKGASGTYHVQGYLHFKQKKHKKTVEEMFTAIYNNKPHMEVPMDKKCNQYKYCWKDDTAVRPELTRFEKGERGDNQGKRNDIIKVRDAIKEGKTLIDLIEDDDCVATVAKYPNFIHMVRNLYLKKSVLEAGWVPKTVYIYWGDTGTGKSRRAHHEAKTMYGTAGVYYKSKDKDWFDWYDGEPGLVLDEFYGAEFTPGFLLALLDGHFFSLNCKRLGAMASNLKTIWITSNVAPEQWWQNGNIPNAVRSALRRRFTKVEHFTEAGGRWEPPKTTAVIPATPEPVASTSHEITERPVEPELPRENQANNEWYYRGMDQFDDTELMRIEAQEQLIEMRKQKKDHEQEKNANYFIDNEAKETDIISDEEEEVREWALKRTITPPKNGLAKKFKPPGKQPAKQLHFE